MQKDPKNAPLERLEDLLAALAAGELEASAVAKRLRSGAVDCGDVTLGLPAARLDLSRELRCGIPEAIFAAGKSIEDLVAIVAGVFAKKGAVLVTRVRDDQASELRRSFSGGSWSQRARVFSLGGSSQAQLEGGDESRSTTDVALVSAGTSDLEVAEEAAAVLEYAGARVERFVDVGIAGLHRLMSCLDEIREARVVIAVAGMDGALPTVLAGLVRAPVIAVPTSVGYGASFEGLAPLLTMLTACAPGVAVVNIDNGYGAAAMALKILAVE